MDGIEANLSDVLAVHPAFLIGSDARSNLRLTVGGIQPAHAFITQQADGYYIAPRVPSAVVRLNGKSIRQPTRFSTGDALQVGDVNLTIAQSEGSFTPLPTLTAKQAALPVGYTAPQPRPAMPQALVPAVASASVSAPAVTQPREIYYPQAASQGGISLTALFSGLVTLAIVAFVVGYAFFSSSPVTAADITSRYAFKDGHVTVVMFETSWCIYCKQQKPMLNDIAADYRGKVYNQFLDAEAPVNAEMVTAFNVNSYPVTIIFNDEGQVAAKFLGLTDARIIRQALDQALRESGQSI